MDRIYISTKDFPISDKQRELFEEIAKTAPGRPSLCGRHRTR